MKRTIITIGRQTGSGGREIGVKVADALGIPYYDREIVSRAAEMSDMTEEFINAHDEKKSGSLMYSLVMDNISPPISSIPSNDRVFLAQFNAIKEAAKEGSCVIIGRCADYALEDDPDLLSIFIYADYDFRAARIQEETNLTGSGLRNLIAKTDKSRSNYYNYYTGKKWGKMTGYHMCLDSSKLGIDTCVKFICEIARDRK